MFQLFLRTASFVVGGRFRRQARRFLKLTADCQDVQARVRQRLLALNASSHFSRQRGLRPSMSLDEFRLRLPISDFEYYRPYVDRLRRGDTHALLGNANPLLMFTLSSGTTADSKYIPITESFLKSYRSGWQTWGICTYDAHPTLYSRHIFQIASNYDKFRSDAGTPCGNISGLCQKMQSPVVRLRYTLPECLLRIDQPDVKTYTALRLGVADRKVAMPMTANPSTLIHFAKQVDLCRDSLIRDIHDGTLTPPGDVPQQVLRKLRWRLRPNRSRARELTRLVEQTGRLAPVDFWPDLTVLAVWTGGSAGAYLRNLPHYYGNVPVRDHGLSASEGRMTIPFEDGQSSGVLDIVSNYFEFIPEDEHGRPNPTVLEAHELQENNNYFILLTTASGLYRYDIRDVVRCTGFRGTTPLLQFLHKGAHVANVTGEKLTESQVVDALRQALVAVPAPISYYVLTPSWGDPPRYHLLVEADDLRSPAIAERLRLEVDRQLRQINCEYDEKRATSRLAPVELTFLQPGSWQKFMRKRQSRAGGSLEQYKHPCLVPDMNFLANLSAEYGIELTGQGLSPRPAVLKRAASLPQSSRTVS